MFDLTDLAGHGALGNVVANEAANKKIQKLIAEQARTRQKLADAELKVRQMENKLKRYENKASKAERNARTHRLIERGAIAEKFIPNAESLTNDEFADALARAFRATN